jgi:hypothetical protein
LLEHKHSQAQEFLSFQHRELNAKVRNMAERKDSLIQANL